MFGAIKNSIASATATVVACLLLAFYSSAQILNPIKWSFEWVATSETEALFRAKARIEKGWHLYAQEMNIEDGQGPERTVFTFIPSKDWQPVGTVVERSRVYEEKAEVWDGMMVRYFKNEAVFEQKFRVKRDGARLKGNVYSMVCDDKQCLPPEETEFDLVYSRTGAPANSDAAEPNADGSMNDARSAGEGDENFPGGTKEAESTAADSVQNGGEKGNTRTSDSGAKGALWGIFLAGLLGGFIALLTPCVFPMIPLTVSYFTKQTGSRKQGVMKALLYGLSIVVIYVGLGLIVTFAFGSDALNAMASDIWFNLAFFVLLVVFGISFLGAFELTLPSSWVNKADTNSERGGWAGIFFMAFTLALVSFSCTGPIIGTLLVEASTRGAVLGPAVGMTGFALALALPFSLFALFPGWLKSLPRSGGWLNRVKVVLGLLELAFALKFLSNVDLAYHWGILDREVFLVIWIALFLSLSLYLMGFIRFPHDDPGPEPLSVPRFLLSVVALSFTFYLVPGLWGATLKSVNAFLPPMATQDFDMSRPAWGVGGPQHSGTVVGQDGSGYEQAGPSGARLYSDLFHCPHGLSCFFDLDEGLAYAEKANKPVMIDFTGHSCVNCRKMEASVWADPEVLQMLRDSFVLISLYVDDKTALPASQQYVSAFSGKKVKTLGNKWSDYQASVFGINSQPYYVLMTGKKRQLTKPSAYDPDVERYRTFLRSGLRVFREQGSGFDGK
jgi:thiol:disulfide interchange protein DsbD